uniref:Speckle-type POZ protein (inferred by orthology to a human protein) n=1 Tax=Strongyloides venezuelensis TaxID=75913 RepID=A0A0K0FG82_STRVS
MTSNESSLNPNNQIIIKKKIEKASIIWSINNFSICKEKPGESKQSPIFSSDTDNKIKWSLLMYPKGNGDKNKDYISLYLKWEESNNVGVKAMWIFYIKNFKGENKYIKFTNTTKFNKSKIMCGNSQFFERNLLLDSDSKFLVNDTLTLGCKIFYFCGAENTVNTPTNNNGNESLNTFSNDFEKMLQTSKFRDCVIKVKDSEINTHRSILAGRSGTFDSILAGKQKESTPIVIEINDFSLEAVKAMIKYLYTDKLPEMDDMACEMLAIGNEYLLNELKSKAEESLINSLSKDNVCDHLVLSESNSAEVLQEWCLRFIYLNPEIMVDSSKWEKIAECYPILVGKLFMIFANIE